VGKKTAAKQMAAHAEIASNNNDLDQSESGFIFYFCINLKKKINKIFLVNGDSKKKQSKLVSFMMNDQEIELEIIQGSALEVNFDEFSLLLELGNTIF
jgi:hypothetical protein